MVIDLPQLRAANAGERLTGRAAHYDIEGIDDRTEFETLRKLLGWRQDISRRAVFHRTVMKIDAVGTGRVRIVLDCRHDAVASRVKAERESATSRKTNPARAADSLCASARSSA